MMITGFILGILCLATILLGFVVPRYYDVFVPPERRDEGTEETVPCEVKTSAAAVNANVGVVTTEDGGEAGLVESSSGGKSSSPDANEKHDSR